MWQQLSGREATLFTGHCLIDGSRGRRLRAVARTVVRFAVPTDRELAAYVASGEPLAMAGAFSIEGLGAPFVAGIDGDPTNVLGLSLPLLRRMLADLGVAITDLWRTPVPAGPAWPGSGWQAMPPHLTPRPGTPSRRTWAGSSAWRCPRPGSRPRRSPCAWCASGKCPRC